MRLFLSLWLVFVFFGDPLLEINTVRYLFLSRAVAEDHSFEVDRFAHASKGDLAEAGGHLYSGSLPGIGLMLAPVAALARVVQPFSPVRPNVTLQLLALALFNAPASALAVVLLAQLLAALGTDAGRTTLLAISAAFGTNLFFFTSKLSDYPVVFLLELIIIRAVREPESAARLLLTGGALGIITTVNNLPAALMILLLLATLPLAPFTAFLRRWLIILAAAAPCLVARSLYLKACFGSTLADPLAFSAARISVVDLAREGSFAARVIADAPHALYDITIGPVGIFVFAPVFLLLFAPLVARAAPGTDDAFAARLRRALVLIVGVNTLAHLLLIGGIWRGGASWGPRYMLYSAPLLVIPIAHFTRGIRTRTLAIFCGGSIFINWVGVQYGYNESLLDELGLFLIGGPTTPAFRLMWMHWAMTPSPERIALVMEETPRIGHYYAFTHPTPLAGYALLAILLLALWLPIIRRLDFSTAFPRAANSR